MGRLRQVGGPHHQVVEALALAVQGSAREDRAVLVDHELVLLVAARDGVLQLPV